MNQGSCAIVLIALALPCTASNADEDGISDPQEI